MVFFARQMCSFILRIQSSMTTFTFLFETQFQDAIQSGDHDSNNFSIGKKADYEINYKRIKIVNFFGTLKQPV